MCVYWLLVIAIAMAIDPNISKMGSIFHSLFLLSFLGSISILGYSLGKRSCIQQEVSFNELYVSFKMYLI